MSARDRLMLVVADLVETFDARGVRGGIGQAQARTTQRLSSGAAFLAAS
jgi:hypothetical protein